MTTEAFTKHLNSKQFEESKSVKLISTRGKEYLLVADKVKGNKRIYRTFKHGK